MDSDGSGWDQPEVMNKLIYGKVLDPIELEENLDYIVD